MSERVTNSFNGGMSSDIDKKLRKNETFENSINGRLVFNKDGSLSWESINGNKSAIGNLPFGSVVLGSASFNDFCIIMIKTPSHDEIGSVRFDSKGLMLVVHS